MNIAICDDNKLDALTARKVIRNTLNSLNKKADIEYYSNVESIQNKLFKKKEPLDLLILDIDMPGSSGLELAEKLRESNLKLLIIFLSNYEEFVFKAIEFQPFRYIRKTKLEIEMPIAIQSFINIIRINSDKQLVLNTDDGEMRVMVSDIMYFETDGRKLSICLNNDRKLLVNKTIIELRDMIAKEKFIPIHRSCVVNADYVKKMHDTILTMKNGQQLVVSRRKYKDIKRQILDLWGEQL